MRQEAFVMLVIGAFCRGAEELGWVLRGFDKDGMATFEHKEDKDNTVQVNLQKMIADIIFLDSNRPGLGEAQLDPAKIPKVLKARLAILAILDAIVRLKDEKELWKELRKIEKHFKGRLLYWKGKKKVPSLWLWLQDGKEVQ
jgi:hypothetical protein